MIGGAGRMPVPPCAPEGELRAQAPTRCWRDAIRWSRPSRDLDVIPTDPELAGAARARGDSSAAWSLFAPRGRWNRPVPHAGRGDRPPRCARRGEVPAAPRRCASERHIGCLVRRGRGTTTSSSHGRRRGAPTRPMAPSAEHADGWYQPAQRPRSLGVSRIDLPKTTTFIAPRWIGMRSTHEPAQDNHVHRAALGRYAGGATGSVAA